MLNSIMGDEANWDKLPCELLIVIVQKLRLCQDLERFSAVSKYWKSVVSGLSQDEKPLLPPESPHLFLAEQVAEGALTVDITHKCKHTESSTVSAVFWAMLDWEKNRGLM